MEGKSYRPAVQAMMRANGLSGKNLQEEILILMEQAENNGWRQGLAYAVGNIVHGRRDHGTALEVLQQSGVGYAELKEAGAAQFDLKYVRDAIRKG